MNPNKVVVIARRVRVCRQCGLTVCPGDAVVNVDDRGGQVHYICFDEWIQEVS